MFDSWGPSDAIRLRSWPWPNLGTAALNTRQAVRLEINWTKASDSILERAVVNSSTAAGGSTEKAVSNTLEDIFGECKLRLMKKQVHLKAILILA